MHLNHKFSREIKACLDFTQQWALRQDEILLWKTEQQRNYVMLDYLIWWFWIQKSLKIEEGNLSLCVHTHTGYIFQHSSSALLLQEGGIELLVHQPLIHSSPLVTLTRDRTGTGNTPLLHPPIPNITASFLQLIAWETGETAQGRSHQARGQPHTFKCTEHTTSSTVTGLSGNTRGENKVCAFMHESLSWLQERE